MFLTNIMLAGACILLFMRPLICQAAFPYIDMAFWIAIFLIFGLYMVKNIKGLLRNTYFSAFFIFMAGMYLSSYGQAIEQTDLAFLCYISCAIMIAFIASSYNACEKNTVIKFVIAGGVLISLIAIEQRFFGFGRILASLSGQTTIDSYARDIFLRKRVFATFCSPNILGGYLIIVLSLLVSRVLINARPINCLISALFAYALLLTQSLGAILSLVVAFAAISPFCAWQPIVKNKKKVTLIMIGLLIALFVIIIRGKWFFDLTDSQNSIQQRLYWWETALKMIRAHPFKGIGIGNFANQFYMYSPQAAIETRYAHNMFLQIWAEQGILGLIGILSIVVIFLKRGLLSLKNGVNLGVFMAGVAFIIHNMLDCSFYFPEASLLWWACIGLILSDERDIK